MATTSISKWKRRKHSLTWIFSLPILVGEFDIAHKFLVVAAIWLKCQALWEKKLTFNYNKKQENKKSFQNDGFLPHSSRTFLVCDTLFETFRNFIFLEQSRTIVLTLWFWLDFCNMWTLIIFHASNWRFVNSTTSLQQSCGKVVVSFCAWGWGMLPLPISGGSIPPTGQKFLSYMQVFEKSGKFVCWRPPLSWRVGAPSYGEYWIRPCPWCFWPH